MELRHLRYFATVAEEQSFTRAVGKLHVAQPSLTRQVKNLEEELGVKLLNRVKGRISLTDHGRSFLENARRILAMSADSVRAIESARSVQQLRIGYRGDLRCDLLPSTLIQFRRAWPRVALNVIDMTYSEQLAALEACDIDLGFIGIRHTTTTSNANLVLEAVAQNDVLVAVPQRSVLSKKPTIHLTDLRQIFLVGLSDTVLPGWHEWLNQLSSKEQFVPEILQEANAEQAALKFVAAGLGVALVPEQVKLFPHRGVVFRPVRPSLKVEAYIAWRNDNKAEYLSDYIQMIRCAATK